MPTFEIAVGPPSVDNLRTFRTPRTDRRPIEDPAATHQRGSITSDRKQGMTLEWANEEEFLVWRAAEESEKTIELIVSQTVHSDSPIWRERRILKCSREWTGGRPAQSNTAGGKANRKTPSKKTGCRCRLTIKLYRHTKIILGKYENEHDHPLGDENLRFTRTFRRPLPDEEILPPSQRTLTETAEHMGTRRWKRPRPTDGVKNTDPYSSGSGKDAAPDAQTAAQNTDVYTCAPTADPAELPSQPPKRRRKLAPPAPPFSVPLQWPSAPLAWYPTHVTYPFGAYFQVPHQAT